MIITRIIWFLSSAVKIVIVAIIALMVLRMITDAADLNPFTWASRTIRRLTDSFVTPARRLLHGLKVDPKFAALFVVLLTILLGWFFLWLSGELISTIAGVVESIAAAKPIAAIGYIIYGGLSIYSILIFIRIVFSWGMVGYSNRLMRFLINVTEPLLGPLRRIIPPLGPMDISPIFAFIIIWLFQKAIVATLF